MEKRKIVDDNLYNILTKAGVNVKEVESVGVKTWVDVPNPFLVPTLTDPCLVEKVWYNGKEQVFSITFDDGVSYDYTANHRLAEIRDGYNWKMVKDLKNGNKILLSDGVSHTIIKSIEAGEVEHTWDISVNDAEHYFMENGVVSHNSSSIIVGNTSPSIEPYNSNVYMQKTSSGRGMNTNKFLEKLIQEKVDGDDTLDYDDIMSSILSNSGSVQEVSCLTDHEKDVFKTFKEVDQRWIIQHASDRQQYIDQGQSVNLFLDPSEVNFSDVHNILFNAWKMGLKTLYYNRSSNTQQTADIYKFEKYQREQLNEDDSNECVACEG